MDIDAHVKKLERFHRNMKLLLGKSGIDIDSTDFEQHLSGLVTAHNLAGSADGEEDPFPKEGSPEHYDNLIKGLDEEIGDLNERMGKLESLAPLVDTLPQMKAMTEWFAGNREKLEKLLDAPPITEGEPVTLSGSIEPVQEPDKEPAQGDQAAQGADTQGDQKTEPAAS